MVEVRMPTTENKEGAKDENIHYSCEDDCCKKGGMIELYPGNCGVNWMLSKVILKRQKRELIGTMCDREIYESKPHITLNIFMNYISKQQYDVRPTVRY